MTTNELRKAEARFQRASQRADTLRQARNESVRRALDAGWSHAAIARITGLSRGRIGQIAARG